MTETDAFRTSQRIVPHPNNSSNLMQIAYRFYGTAIKTTAEPTVFVVHAVANRQHMPMRRHRRPLSAHAAASSWTRFFGFPF
jgi:hypothetical protein